MFLLLVAGAWAQSPSPSLSPGTETGSPISDPNSGSTPSASATPAPEATSTAIPVESNIESPGLPRAKETPLKPAVHLLQGPLTYRRLFPVAASGNYTAEERSYLISRRLNNALTDADGVAPLLTLQEGQNNVVIRAGHRVVATVLPEDVLATSPGMEVTIDDIMDTAEIWREELEDDFAEGIALQNPHYYYYATGIVVLLFLLCLMIHKKLNHMALEESALPRWLIQLCIWVFYVVLALWTFPPLRQWAVAVHQTTFLPIFRLIGVIIATSLVVHLFEKVTVKYFESLLTHEHNIFSRKTRRIKTLQQVTLVTGRLVLVLIAIGVFISLLPINFTPILASASVVGVAFGFAAQDTLKDLFGGLSILLEDRFGVGDWIDWNGHSGAVEGFNLKSTRLRTVDGSVIIIPNGDLRVVSNLSNEWAQVDYRIGIAYEADFKTALACLVEEAQALSEEWPDRVIGPPDVKGVEKLGDNSVTLRLFLKTQPLAQWDVHREMNARVKARFDREGISIPFPQRTVWLRQSSENLQGSSLDPPS